MSGRPATYSETQTLKYMPYLGEISVQLEKELRNFFRKYLKEFAQLSLIHRTHTIRDHFKFKDKQAHLERCNVVYKLLNVLVVIPILVKHKGI